MSIPEESQNTFTRREFANLLRGQAPETPQFLPREAIFGRVMTQVDQFGALSTTFEIKSPGEKDMGLEIRIEGMGYSPQDAQIIGEKLKYPNKRFEMLVMGHFEKKIDNLDQLTGEAGIILASVSGDISRRKFLKGVGFVVLAAVLSSCVGRSGNPVDPSLSESTRVAIEGATRVIVNPSATPIVQSASHSLKVTLSPTGRIIVESVPQNAPVEATNTPIARVTITPEKISPGSSKRKELAEWLAKGDNLEMIQGRLRVMPCQLDNREYNSLSSDLRNNLSAVKWNSCVSACMTSLCRLKEKILSGRVTGPQIGDVIMQLISRKFTWNGEEYPIILPGNCEMYNNGIVTAVQILTGAFFEERLINPSIYTIRNDKDSRPPSISRTDYPGTLQRIANVTNAGGLVLIFGTESQQIPKERGAHSLIVSGVDLGSGILTIHDPLREPPGPLKSTIEQFFDDENGEIQFYGALGFVPKNI